MAATGWAAVGSDGRTGWDGFDVQTTMPGSTRVVVIEQPRADRSDCENDFHDLNELFDKMRADRDRWQGVATVLVSAMEDPLDAQQRAAVGAYRRGSAVTDDIVTRLRNECDCSDDCRAVNDPCRSM